jgi:hypothetical protein
MPRRELKFGSENTRKIGVVHNSFVAIAEDTALGKRIEETGCEFGSNVEFNEFLKLAASPSGILIRILEEFQNNSRCGSELFKNFFQNSS